MRKSYNRYRHSLGQVMSPAPVIYTKKNNTKTVLLWVGGVAILGLGTYFLFRRFGLGFGNQPRFSTDTVNVAANSSVTVNVLDGIAQVGGGVMRTSDGQVNYQVAADGKSISFRGPTSVARAATHELKFNLTDRYGRNPVERKITVTVQTQ
jgi:hypothetical protein